MWISSIKAVLAILAVISGKRTCDNLSEELEPTSPLPMSNDQQVERSRRWRLVLGRAAEQSQPPPQSEQNSQKKGKGEDSGSAESPPDASEGERTQGDKSDPAPTRPGFHDCLSGTDDAVDRTLEALYDHDRDGGLGKSTPAVQRWLGDIRTYFPNLRSK